MSAKSSIEWTDATYTPIRARNRHTGKIGWHCVHKSPGCENCYAESLNKRLGTGFAFKPGHEKDIEIFLDEKMLLAPLRWKKPRMIFVCSMTDLFADFVRDEWIDKIFTVMALASQHTFQILTKRSSRMRSYFLARSDGDPWAEAADEIGDLCGLTEHPHVLEPRDMPLPNVWLGVSAEFPRRATYR